MAETQEVRSVELHLCMDYRIEDTDATDAWRLITQTGYGRKDVAVVRSAGPIPFLDDLRERASNSNLKLVIFATHNQCGMAGAVFSHISGVQLKVAPETLNAIITLADAVKEEAGKTETAITSSGDVEKFMPAAIKGLVEKKLKEAGRTDVKVMFTSPLTVSSGQHVNNVIAVIGLTDSTDMELKTAAGTNPAYVVRATRPDQAMLSLDIAGGGLGKTEFVLMPGSQRWSEATRACSNSLSSLPTLPKGATVTLKPAINTKIKL